jgi:hypothetical protein
MLNALVAADSKVSRVQRRSAAATSGGTRRCMLSVSIRHSPGGGGAGPPGEALGPRGNLTKKNFLWGVARDPIILIARRLENLRLRERAGGRAGRRKM